MRQFMPDPYPDPIDTRRYPDLADLDMRFRRQAAGLPVEPLSPEDNQFLRKMDTFLLEEAKRKESNRILSNLQQRKGKQQTRQRRQVPDIEQRMRFADRLLTDQR